MNTKLVLYNLYTRLTQTIYLMGQYSLHDTDFEKDLEKLVRLRKYLDVVIDNLERFEEERLKQIVNTSKEIFLSLLGNIIKHLD